MSTLETLLKDFVFERVLSHNTRTKLIYLLGRVKGEACILSLEKLAYDDTSIPTLSQHVNKLKDEVENNIYGWGLGNIQLDKVNTQIKYIYPATELHIRKYQEQARYMIRETPTVYTQVTKPYIDSIPAERIDWVRNILQGKAEVDRVLYHDKDPKHGFVVLPDMKWDGQPDSMYLVAIVMNPDLLSLRSLTAEHIPLLKRIRSTCQRIAKEQQGLTGNDDTLYPQEFRLFLHYQPSYYHLHIHITALTMQDPPGAMAGQAHLLDTVIDNLELYPDYYQKASLSYVIGEQHPLYSSYKTWVEQIEQI
ncbi:HIT-like domain-containing protein [Halteromyces radiatus]|uniref:HIT-like domain-containing protein n=1 Tax=Halteromyces radiatus TaxID=101107 RepID=UPI00221F68E8|nr:HIT-like domain-containing protein [Halteromyces radiatus]KAI8089744.1 HIT-like domain-containing protein [Halteromyces radiatus]